jgi:chromosomal replication initiator protein
MASPIDIDPHTDKTPPSKEGLVYNPGLMVDVRGRWFFGEQEHGRYPDRLGFAGAMDQEADIGATGAANPVVIWKVVQRELRAEFGEDNWRSWISRLELVDVTDEEILFSAPTQPARDWMRRNVQQRIEARLMAHGVDNALIRIEAARVLAQASQRKARVGAPGPDSTEARGATGSAHTGTVHTGTVHPGAAQSGAGATGSAGPALRVITPQPAKVGTVRGVAVRRTFDSYRTGNANKAAANVARRIAETVGEPASEAFGLTVVTGDFGVGKSHLLEAAANHAVATNPDALVVYLTVEAWVTEFVGSIQRRTGQQFKADMRKADLLILDDLPFIAGKAGSCEELLHTLDALLAAGKRVMLSSAYPVDQIEGLDERLRSRLRAAVVCHIERPDYELRVKILKAKAEQYAREIPGFDVPPAVFDVIAGNLPLTGRDLDGALRRLAATLTMTGRPVTLDDAKEVLRDQFVQPQRMLQIEAIQKATCKHFGISQAELVGASRQRAYVRPRQIAMWIAKHHTERALGFIGERFGGRHHTTVMNALECVDAQRGRDRRLAEDIAAIERLLGVGKPA